MNTYDVVVLDRDLPQLHGDALCRQLVDSASTSRILMLTAAAMVDDPADLEQPRSETPPYTIRRSEAFEKYRKGSTTATTYPEADKAKLSTTGQ